VSVAPRATYSDLAAAGDAVTLRHCSAYELKYGIDTAQLMAQVRAGRVVAFWLPVGGEGE